MAEEGTAAVALCADLNIEVGVHVTLYSLLENADCHVRIYFIHKGYTSTDLDRLRSTLAPFDGRYELRPIGADDAQFRGFKSTRGDRFTYVRLLLPELIDESRLLYLDCDLIVGVDVGALIQQPLDGFALGASGIGDFEWSNDASLCRSLGLDVSAPYFNAGVLLFDLDAWRREELTRRCIAFAGEHAQQLATADQAILNFVFYRAFKALGPECNQLLFPSVAAVSLERDRRCIFHFVGAPKPWDLLGRQLHRNYGLYEDVVRHTQMRDYRFHRNLTLTGLARTLRNYRAYASLLRAR